jgi:hypothetical protein
MLGKIIPNEVLEHIAKIGIAACNAYTGLSEKWEFLGLPQHDCLRKMVDFLLENPNKTITDYFGNDTNNCLSEDSKRISIQNNIFRAVVIAHIPLLELFIQDHQHELKSE